MLVRAYQRLRHLAADTSLRGQVRRILFLVYVLMVAVTAQAAYSVWTYAAERKPIAATISALTIAAAHAWSWYAAGKYRGRREAEDRKVGLHERSA